ncbi:MAG: hypothetical protein QOH00_1022 [Gaiellales bacterium]|jgi:hypothetical protein|nr:hypothetical protein [Gaiellales bacterium]
MNIAPLRAARSTGLLLVAVVALSYPAAAFARPGHTVSSRASSSSVSFQQCPCNADLPQALAANASSPAECPCNAGLPDGPSVSHSARPTFKPIASGRARGILRSGASDVQCPCNPDLPRHNRAGVSSP